MSGEESTANQQLERLFFSVTIEIATHIQFAKEKNIQSEAQQCLRQSLEIFSQMKNKYFQKSNINYQSSIIDDVKTSSESQCFMSSELLFEYQKLSQLDTKIFPQIQEVNQRGDTLREDRDGSVSEVIRQFMKQIMKAQKQKWNIICMKDTVIYNSSSLPLKELFNFFDISQQNEIAKKILTFLLHKARSNE